MRDVAIELQPLNINIKPFKSFSYILHGFNDYQD
jgi:hypothetical protein